MARRPLTTRALGQREREEARLQAEAKAEVAYTEDTEQEAEGARWATIQAEAERAQGEAESDQAEAEGELHRLLNESQGIVGKIEKLIASPTFDEHSAEEVAALERRQSLLPTYIKATHLKVLRCQEASLLAQRRLAQVGQERAQADALALADECERLRAELIEKSQRLAWTGAAAGSGAVQEIDRRVAEVRYRMNQVTKGADPDERPGVSAEEASAYIQARYAAGPQPQPQPGHIVPTAHPGWPVTGKR